MLLRIHNRVDPVWLACYLSHCRRRGAVQRALRVQHHVQLWRYSGVLKLFFLWFFLVWQFQWIRRNQVVPRAKGSSQSCFHSGISVHWILKSVRDFDRQNRSKAFKYTWDFSKILTLSFVFPLWIPTLSYFIITYRLFLECHHRVNHVDCFGLEDHRHVDSGRHFPWFWWLVDVLCELPYCEPTDNVQDTCGVSH